jgi:hypothetical protein
VQGRDTLVQHFRASKFPSPDIELMPLVYTRTDNGLAADPVAIHVYLEACDAAAAAGQHVGGGMAGGDSEGAPPR